MAKPDFWYALAHTDGILQSGEVDLSRDPTFRVVGGYYILHDYYI